MRAPAPPTTAAARGTSISTPTKDMNMIDDTIGRIPTELFHMPYEWDEEKKIYI
jgi:hypothetical protein